MPVMIRSFGATYDDGHMVNDHLYYWGRCVYSASGAIRVYAEGARLLVPSAQAVWVPPGAHSSLNTRGRTSLKTVYLPAERCRELPYRCQGVEVEALLRELILDIVRTGYLDSNVRGHAARAELLEMLLIRAAVSPFSLIMPSDARARRAAEIIRHNLVTSPTLESISGSVGVSARTLQRLFLHETGMHLAEWRQAARMMAATETLLDGVSVAEASLAAGYASPSAFICAFQQRTGRTPLQFRQKRRD
jgi:AraC-like DNA-binding protein